MSMTKEEKIQDLKERIKILKSEVEYFDSKQMASKLILNGSYGAFANQHFCFFDNDIAGTVTAMGRNLIQLMDRKNEQYFYEHWHKDVHIHKLLGIKTEDIKPIDGSYLDQYNSLYFLIDRTGTRYETARAYEDLYEMSLDKLEKWAEVEADPKIREIFNEVVLIKHNEIRRKVSISIYADTDSLFVAYQPAMDSCNWQGDPMDFINILNKNRIQKYFTNILDKYALKNKVENIEDFELERIDQSVIFLEKKCYVQNVVLEDGIPYKPLSYMPSKGIEIVKSSTPKFARERAMELIKYLFAHPKDYKIQEVLNIVKELKKAFMWCAAENIEDVSMSCSMNNYEKGVIEDTKELKFNTGAHFSVKAAAFHNYLLKKNPEMLTKYEFVKSGNKIKYYYTKNSLHETFGYNRGSFPTEFAPEIDLDLQFEKSVLNIINRFMGVLNMPIINKRISVVMALFK
jgi:DNA polymerase elongation subunit (family B)